MPDQDANPLSKKGERLQVVLARHGLASRRGVVTLIEEGKVQVNGAVVREKGFRVDTSCDQIAVDGTALPIADDTRKVYYAFHKPKGVMTTMQDPNAEETVADYFEDLTVRVFPVGRLDRDTTGLLLLTNDGELAFRLTHPKFGVQKKYLVRVRGLVAAVDIKKLELGVDLEEGRTAPCQIQVDASSKRETDLTVILHEGKKRQIRRIFQKIGHRVLMLERVSYGPLSLGSLPVGAKRRLSESEVRSLYEAAGLARGGNEKKR